jgi:hypothetical protein
VMIIQNIRHHVTVVGSSVAFVVVICQFACLRRIGFSPCFRIQARLHFYSSRHLGDQCLYIFIHQIHNLSIPA